MQPETESVVEGCCLILLVEKNISQTSRPVALACRLCRCYPFPASACSVLRGGFLCCYAGSFRTVCRDVHALPLRSLRLSPFCPLIFRYRGHSPVVCVVVSGENSLSLARQNGLLICSPLHSALSSQSGRAVCHAENHSASLSEQLTTSDRLLFLAHGSKRISPQLKLLLWFDPLFVLWREYPVAASSAGAPFCAFPFGISDPLGRRAVVDTRA